MTPKILSLEEIENIQYAASLNLGVSGSITLGRDSAEALIATARAYHELKKKEVHVSCGQCGMSTFVDIEDTDNNKLDDKPHLPTLKVIVEAMKCGVGMVWEGDHINGARQVFTPTNVIQSLEKHLE